MKAPLGTKSKKSNRKDVYDVAMMNLNSILQRELPPRNAKRSGSKWTRDPNSKRLKRF